MTATAPAPADVAGPAAPEGPVRIALFGLGGRGAEAYGRWIVDHPERATVVAVAEHRPARRDRFADLAGVPAENRFGGWRELLADAGRLALDAVVVALPDNDHIDPAVAAAEQGLAVLLEKPVATEEASLRDLEQRIAPLGARVGVCYVLRETPFWRSVHTVVRSGVLGDVATIRLEENIGFWHFAHSYVRGNWRNVEGSSPMVLAKTSHDLDLLRWLAGAAPRTVSSVGSLLHFREDHAPAGAPSHCVKGCPVAASCPFYAPRYYVERLAGVDGWPVALLGDDTSPEGRLRALTDGPYGRCVYRCDNDVVDHQQTVLDFPGGLTATLTASAFTGDNTRTVQITGTRGELSGRMESGGLRLQLFAPGPHALPDLGATPTLTSSGSPMGHDVLEWVAAPPSADVADHRGHAGGDDGLTERFVTAVRSPDFAGTVTTTLDAALDSHWMAFAAERSRLTGRAVSPDEVRYGSPVGARHD